MKKKINQKPIDIDLHLKYICNKCDQHHWLSYLESKTKNFKVVCDCGNVFKVKRVHSFIIKYLEEKPPQAPKTINKETIPQNLLESGSKILQSFGYSSKEADEMILKAFDTSGTLDINELIKLALSKFGEKIHDKLNETI